MSIAILQTMIHIGIDARLTYYRMGGTSSYIRYLLKALQSLDHTNTYTVLQSRKANEVLASEFRHASLWTPCHHRIERLALSVELTRLGLDVLHSPDFIPPYRGASKHIITVHDLAFLIYPHHMTEESKAYYNAQIEVAVNKADHILAVSEATRTDLIRLLHVTPSKITVQHHGVDSRFHPLSHEETSFVLKRYHLPDRYIAFLSTIEPRKNIDGLLIAYKELQKRLPDTPPLVLIGRDGWLVEDLLALIDQTSNVIRIQDAEHDVLPALLNRASMLVMPSHYEGFGMPVLEAMACGIIPIVSNLSSFPEVVGDVGIQIEPNDHEAITDAMYTVLTADPEWIEEQKQAAIHQAGKFTWENSARIAKNTYEMVMK